MPTTVADADVDLHMDARPLVAEIQRKLGPIIDKVAKRNPLQLNVDDRYMFRSGQRATKKLQKVLDSIKPYKPPKLEKSLFSRVFDQAGRFVKKVVIPVELSSNDKLKADIRRISSNIGNKIRLRIPVTLESATRDLFDFRSGEGAFSRLRKGFSSAGESAAGFFRSVGRGFGTAFSAVASFGSKAGETLGAVFSVLGKLAGPAISAVLVLIGIKLVGVLITATALAAGLGAALVAAFAIAGSAAAIFGVAALPGILKIVEAVQGGNDEIRKLPKGLQVGAKAIQSLGRTFNTWVKPFEPLTGRIVAQWARLGEQVLPKLSPVVTAMGNAFTFLGERAEKAINGPTFARFLTMLEERGPRVFNNLTSAAGSFGAGLANALGTVAPFAESLSAKIAEIAQKFENWTNSVQGQKDIREFFEWVNNNKQGFVDGLKEIGKQLLQLGKDLASEDIGKDLKSIGDGINAIATAINSLNWALNNAKENLGLIKDLLTGKTFSDENKGEFKVPKGKQDPRSNALGAGMIDSTALVDSARLAFREVGRVASDAWRDISVGASGLAEDVGAGLAPLGSKMSAATSTAVEQVQGLLSGGKSRWTGTVASATESAAWAWAPIAPRMGQIAWDASNQASSGLWAGVGMVSSAAWAMSNSVTDNLDDMGAGAYGAGYEVGDRAAAGIWDSIGKVRAAASAMADEVADHWPGSPVRKGPLTVLNHGYAGKQIGKMLAGGIESGAQPLGRALTKTMSVPAGVAMGQRVNSGRGTSKTTTITKSPQFTVVSPSADPMAVAGAVFRQARMSGAF